MENPATPKLKRRSIFEIRDNERKRLSAGSGRNLRNCVKYVPGVSHAR